MPVIRAQATAGDAKEGSTAVDVHVNQGNQNVTSVDKTRPRRLATDVSPFGKLLFLYLLLLIRYENVILIFANWNCELCLI